MMIKKERTLSEVLPSETDQLRLEFSNLNAKVSEITEEIKKSVGELALDVQNLNERISAAAEIIHDVQSKQDAAISAMAEIRQLQAIQDIADSLEGIHQIKKSYADKMNAREAAREQVKRDKDGQMDKPRGPGQNDSEYMSKAEKAGLGTKPPTNAAIKAVLTEKSIDTNLLAISVDRGLAIITPMKFLGDLWAPINAAIRDMGGKWIRDGKKSHWEVKDASA